MKIGISSEEPYFCWFLEWKLAILLWSLFDRQMFVWQTDVKRIFVAFDNCGMLRDIFSQGTIVPSPYIFLYQCFLKMLILCGIALSYGCILLCNCLQEISWFRFVCFCWKKKKKKRFLLCLSVQNKPQYIMARAQIVSYSKWGLNH